MTTFYPTLPYKKFDDGVPDPAYAHMGDAGIDLSVTEDYILEPNEQRMFSTGLAFAIPEGFAGNRVAQMLIVAVAQCQMVKVEKLSDTERGTRGFGSSGIGRL